MKIEMVKKKQILCCPSPQRNMAFSKKTNPKQHCFYILKIYSTVLMNMGHFCIGERKVAECYNKNL